MKFPDKKLQLTKIVQQLVVNIDFTNFTSKFFNGKNIKVQGT